MALPHKLKTAFRIISAVTAGIFLFQQLAWAGDLINTALEQQYKDQSQTFAPSYLQSQEASVETLVTQKQDIQDYIAVQSVPQNGSVQVDLRGPILSSTGSATQALTTTEPSGSSTSSEEASPVLNITTSGGDKITYKNQSIYSVQKTDGTLMTDIAVDSANNLTDALISYPDASTAHIVNGRISNRTVMGTDYYYDTNGLITSSNRGGEVTTYSYTKDLSGSIVDTILTDPEKACHYDNNNRLTKVEYAPGGSIDYDSGMILKVTKPDQGRYLFDIQQSTGGTFTSTLSQYLTPENNIYRYNIDSSNSLTSVSVENSGIVATYNKEGALTYVTKDGSVITQVSIDKTRLDRDTASILYTQRQNEVIALQPVYDTAKIDLDNKLTEKTSAQDSLTIATGNFTVAQAESIAKNAAYDAAYKAYRPYYLAYLPTYNALRSAQMEESRALSVFTDAKCVVSTKQTNYDVAVRIRQSKEAAFNKAKADFEAGTITKQAYDAAAAALASSKSAESLALRVLASVQSLIVSKQAAYDRTVQNRYFKELSYNTAKANLEPFAAAKDRANTARVTASNNLSKASGEKSSSEAAYNLAYNNYSSSQSVYDQALSNLNQAKDNETKSKDSLDLLTESLNSSTYAYSLFTPQDDVLANANKDIDIINVLYDNASRIKQVNKADGTTQGYTDGLPDNIQDKGVLTSYSYTLSNLGNIQNITVDREGIKRIYDEYGNLNSVSLSDVAKITYVNGKVQDIEKSDGTKIKNMTFTESGELDSALVSYPDGSIALYQDAKLLKIINGSGDTINYQDGKIRRVTLEGGTVYDWSYDAGGNVIVSDAAKGEDRTYSHGRLTRVEQLAGIKLITNYYYDNTSNKLVKSEVCQGQDALYTYTYTYENNLTLIHDEDGNTQAYTKNKKLSYLIDSTGKKYSYTYVGKSEGCTEVYFPSGTKVRYDADSRIVDVTKDDGTVIKDITFDTNNVPLNFTYIKDEAVYKIVNGKISQVMAKDGTGTLYYDNGFVKSIQDGITGSLSEYQYYIADAKSFKDVSVFQSGAVSNLSYYINNSTATLRLSANNLEFGTGHDGAKHVTADEGLAAGTYNFTSLTIDAGKTLTIASGAVIKCLGTITVNGTIAGAGTSDISADTVTVTAAGAITTNSHIKANTINNAGTMRYDVIATLTHDYSGSTYVTNGSGPETIDGLSYTYYGNHRFTTNGTGSNNWQYTYLYSQHTSPAPMTYTGFYWNIYDYVGITPGSSGSEGNCAAYLQVQQGGAWNTIASYSDGTNNGARTISKDEYIVSTQANVTGVRVQLRGGYWINNDPSSGSTATNDSRIYEFKAYANQTCEYLNNASYPSSGTFESDVVELDALALGKISWGQTAPAGTQVTIQTRTGDVLTPDSTWSGWSDPVSDPAGSQITSPAGRYIQYKVTMTTSDNRVTPSINLSGNSLFILNYERAPVNGAESASVSRITLKKDGVTGACAADPAELVFDHTYVDGLSAALPAFILNDTQKTIYMKDNIIVSELTAISNPDGRQSEYTQGQLSSVKMPDGVMVTDVKFDADNNAKDFTYAKGGTTYTVSNGIISDALTSDGGHIKYYPYGMVESAGSGASEKKYYYGMQTTGTYANESAFQNGVFNASSFFDSNNSTYLELSANNLEFGTGLDGAKHVTADEGLAAGTYNFTSLTIDAGKTLTLAPGAIIKCLDTAAINGTLKGANNTVSAYIINIGTAGYVSGSGQQLKANTINNYAPGDTVTENYGSNGYSYDNNYNTCIGSGASKGGSGDFRLGPYYVITEYVFGVPKAITQIDYKAYTRSGHSNNGDNSDWWGISIDKGSGYVQIYGGSGDTGHAIKTGLWEGVKKIALRSYATAGGDRDGAAYAYNYELQVTSPVPAYSYASSNGRVPASVSQPAYPSSGTFESNIMEFDTLTLGKISWGQITPFGTQITFQTRTGDTAAPDSTWNDWSGPLSDPAGSQITSPSGKYLQYRINMSTADTTVSPKVMVDGTHAILISYAKFSSDPADTYVRVKENNVTKAYNGSGILIWQEDMLGNRTNYDPSNPQGMIDLSSLKSDSATAAALKDALPGCKLGDAQKVITIYDQGNDNPVETVNADQSITYFENGHPIRIVDKNGVAEVQYSYDAGGNVTGVNLVDARQKLQTSYNQAVSEIVTQKDAALAKLAAAQASDKANIDAQAASIQQQIDAERRQLTREKAQYDPAIFDLSAFNQAFSQLDDYQAQLNKQVQDAYANLAFQVADATAQINANAQTAMQNLINNDYNKVLGDIVQKESSPMIYQYYRSVLGRDPGDDELQYWMDMARAALLPVTVTQITQYIQALPEYADRQARKQNIISGLTAFFSQYLAASDNDKQAMLSSLGLTLDDVTPSLRGGTAGADEAISSIISWLNGQSLHFGDSAFNTVIALLKSAGINRSFEDIGKDAIKIDILAGVITKFTTGDIVISLYAMRKVAAINGLSAYSEKITYDDLKDQVSRGNVIIHIDGRHYVLVTSIDDAKGTVTYTDTTVGNVGQSMTISRNELMSIWKGYSLAKELSSDPARQINVTKEKNIRGSSWWSSFWKGIVNFFQRIVAPVAALLLFVPPLAPLAAIVLGINIIVQTVSFVVHTGTLMDIVWSVVTTAGAALGATVLSNIYSAAGSVFSQISNIIPASIKGVFQNVMQVFNGITGVVRNIATGIGSIFNPTIESSLVNAITTRVISTGIGLGTDFVFRTMHLDPTLSNIGSALFTGAVMGAISSDTNIVASALEYGTIAGVEELGKAVDLDPNITRLSAIMAGSLVGGALDIDGKHLTYDKLMENITPDIVSEAAYIGVTDIGEMLGIDPRISYLAGIGIRSTINAGLQDSDPNQMWQSITNGLLQGVTNIGLNFATEELGISPLLANIGFAAISGAINTGIQEATGSDQNFFQSLFKTYKDNALTFLGYGDPSNAWQQAAYISQILDFSDIVQQKGLVDALNTYGAEFFNAVAVNNIVQSGMSIGQYFASKLAAGQYTTRTLQDNTQVKEVAVKDAQGNTIAKVFFQQKQVGENTYWDLIGGEEFIVSDSHLSWGNFGVDAYGKLGYTDAQLYSMFDSDIQYQQVINGQQAYAEIKDLQGNTLLIIEPTEGGHYNAYNSYGEYANTAIYAPGLGFKEEFVLNSNIVNSYQEDADIIILGDDSNIVTNVDAMMRATFDDNGNVKNRELIVGEDFYNLFQDEDGILLLNQFGNETYIPFKTSALSPGPDTRKVLYFVHNGINNPQREGIAPLATRKFREELVRQGVDEKTIFLEPLYEREEREKPRKDIQRWLKDSLFNEDVIADEIFQKYLAIYQSLTPEQRAALKVGVTYSGSFNPYIRALEKYNMNIETIVNYGGQSIKGVFSGYEINNTHIKNVINIWGENDFYGRLVQEKNFTNVNMINIELKDADHSDFNIEDRYTGSRAELNRKAAQFNAYITKLATNPQLITDVILQRNGVTPIYKDGKIIKYKVDLSKFSCED